MAKFKMPWRSVKKDGLPKDSGIYLTYDTESPNWASAVSYSANHKLFNCRDEYTKRQAHSLAFEVTHWIPLEEVIPDD